MDRNKKWILTGYLITISVKYPWECFRYIYQENLMNNYKYLTKEIIVSDNGNLLHFVSLYLLINIIIYIYIVGMAWSIPSQYTSSTKISQTLVLPLLPINCIQQRQTNPPHLRIECGLWQSCIPKYCSEYKGSNFEIPAQYLMQAMLPTKTTKSNGFKEGSINTLCKWSK